MTDVAEDTPAPKRPQAETAEPPTKPKRKVLTASLVGTSIEFHLPRPTVLRHSCRR
ncbi:hypothetical protein GCM10009603_44660 [Nocardiopsis exhalans]